MAKILEESWGVGEGEGREGGEVVCPGTGAGHHCMSALRHGGLL